MHLYRCIFYFWLMCALVIYFVIRSHRNSNLVWIQIELKFIKGFGKEKKIFYIPQPNGPKLSQPTSLDQPAKPPGGPAASRAAQPRPSTPAAAGRSSRWVRTHSTNPLARIWPNKCASNPLGFKPDPNLSLYPLSCSFKQSLSPSQILLIHYDSKPSWR
jgi:hypothetical protein